MMLMGRLERHNVISKIMQAAQQNTEFLKSTQLTGKDLIDMIKEQRQFSDRWKALGPELASIYVGGKEKNREMAQVDTAIDQWGTKADSALWASLDREFAEQQISLEPFNSGDAFVTSLGDYMDSRGGDPNASNSEKASRLKHFLDDVWNPSVGSQWIPMLVDAGMISKDQQNLLQAKLGTWEGSIKPSFILLYLIIVLIVILVVILFLARRRRKPQPSDPGHETGVM